MRSILRRIPFINTFVLNDANGFTASRDELILKGVNQDVYFYDPASQTIDTLAVNKQLYAIQGGFQPVDVADYLFFSETDFVGTGEVGFIVDGTVSATVIHTYFSAGYLL